MCHCYFCTIDKSILKLFSWRKILEKETCMHISYFVLAISHTNNAVCHTLHFSLYFSDKSQGVNRVPSKFTGFFTFYNGSVAAGSAVCSPLLKFPPPYFLNTTMFLCNKYCHPNGCMSIKGHILYLFEKARTFGLELEDGNLGAFGFCNIPDITLLS